MSNYNQNQPQVAYPPPGTHPQSTMTAAAFSTAPPPPAGYPTMDFDNTATATAPAKTQSRGDGFWKGCCAALCCCCVLDACF